MKKVDSSFCMPSLPILSKAGLMIVDKEPAALRSLENALKKRDYEIVVTDSTRTALEILELQSVGVVICSHDTSKETGLSFLEKVRQRWPNIQRIMMASPEQISRLERHVPMLRLISKPWGEHELKMAIENAFQVFELLRENAELWQLSQRQYRDLQSLNHSLEAKISERTQQLVSAKLVWERTFDAIVDPVAIIRDDHSVLRANLAYADQAQRSVSLVPGQKCYLLVAGRDSPCENCPLGTTDNESIRRGVDIQARGSRTLHVWSYPMQSVSLASESNENINHVCYYRDVTDERLLEGKLTQSEKLASLGLFVGGVAHEVNNPLGTIIALTEVLKTEIEGDEENLEIVHDIEMSADRCRRIIDSLRSFVHGSAQLHQQSIQVSELLVEVVRLFRQDYGGGTPIECIIGDRIPAIRGDVALLHQLFRNLLQNAYHSLPKEDGAIQVSVRVGSSTNSVIVELEDNGSGIRAEDLKHVFEPFFTTKSENKLGSGLGLSISHQIVLKHRGTIDVESVTGKGTKFIIDLPVGEPTGSFRLAELEQLE